MAKKNRKRSARRQANKSVSQSNVPVQQTASVAPRRALVRASNVGFELPSGGTRTANLELRITLKSDLCAGSGDGFSSGIDQDVCIDQLGLPYIPARRIKGCLREASADIDTNPAALAALFGTSGSSDGGALSISNAEMINPSTEGGPAETLARYTYTRAQTKLDKMTGSAADNTLRFLRVVNHYYPDGKEMTFSAPVVVDCEKLALAVPIGEAPAILSSCARALRNIGMERNRGLGAVSCSFVGTNRDEGELDWARLSAKRKVYEKRIDNKRTVLSYAVKLDGPVMLPQQNGTRSHTCIPGTSVLGYFASRLSDREDFDDLFYGGNVRFSPLYPACGDGGNLVRCLPAAPFVVKIKGGRQDGAYCRADQFEENAQGTPKPLKDGFVDPRAWNSVDVETEIAFHHSVGPDGTLYTQNCLSAGQVFAGYIECPTGLSDIFRDILADNSLYFGRSKTAQYGRCSLQPVKNDFSGLGETVDIEKGRRYAVLLESDALVLGGDNGHAQTTLALENALREKGVIGEWYECCDADEPNGVRCITNVSAHVVGGYNAKWNQKKPHVRALDAGSCLVFTAAGAKRRVPATGHVGLRQSEGYGKVRIVPLDAVNPVQTSPKAQEVAAPGAREAARLRAVSYAREARTTCFSGRNALTPSFVGRLTTMVEESQTTPVRGFDSDLDARIASIKDESKRDQAGKLIDGLRNALGGDAWCRDNWRLEKECLLLVLTLGKYYEKQAALDKESER